MSNEQQQDLGKVVSQIQKLLRLSQSNNPHESAVAMGKAQELMDRWKISSACLNEENNFSAPDETIEDFGKKGIYLEQSENRSRWRMVLAVVLAEANQCKIYNMARRNQNGRVTANIAIIGRKSDAEIVSYLFSYVVKEIDRLTLSQGKGLGKSWSNNFRLGCVDAISIKLKEQREALAKTMRAEVVNNSMALVRIDNALAKLDHRGREVEQYVKKMRLKNSPSFVGRDDAHARAQGQRVGASINLNNRSTGSIGSGQKKIG